MNTEFLKRLPLFAGLSDDDLAWLLERSETVGICSGEILMEEGSPGDALYIVLEGEFEFTKRSGQQDVVIATRGAGEVIGEISVLEQVPRTATGRALRDSRLLKISQGVFFQLLSSSPAAVLAILHTVTSRLRHTELVLRQSEKMAALGKLSAGLAHELNNPAAAAQRSTAQMRQTIEAWQRLTLQMDALDLDSRQTESVHRLRDEIVKRAAASVNLDPLIRSDREGELQEWLEERDVDEAWELAPALVTFGWDVETLAEAVRDLSSAQLPLILHWVGSGCSLYALLDEVAKSAARISEIVKAVKTYSFLDQAPIQEVDVHDGLENTLVILRHRLKQGVKVTREYAKDLPKIEAYGSELNQVWTNLIDNAVDAMDGKGEITLRTYGKDGLVVVEIKDSGPGIPPDIQSRIFEPFFTTKAPGIGTGLGLHIVYNIVVDKHRGQITVRSRPGETCFQVSLPVRLKRS
ncbi:MAG: cyclic nucleotide-binding domain-containing protein [Anaerolineae bacterium]|nr:cyclic nucleotide-binding domain-containing protein [Anaerolineae bacterium]